jgi:TonB family protein
LGIHPVAPTGPVAVPGGNRRGTFAATPQGKSGAAGTPDLVGSGKGDSNSKTRNNGHGSLPAGLHVGAADSGVTSSVERNGGASSHGNAHGNSSGDGADGAREVSSLSSLSASPGARPGARAASAVPDDKVTDVDRQVFGGKRFYEMALNMPNLNSSTGSWVIRFAELDAGRKEGELLAPVATEKSDPGYPLELIRANVHGMVTLYAVIHTDGKVGDIRVLNSPDERLDSFAAKALARWKFVPALRAGKPVALEAVVVIPFRVRRSF